MAVRQSDLLAALRELGAPTPAARRRLARKSIKFFAAYYLGLSLWKCQKLWFDELRDMVKGGIVGPPDSGKTEVIARLVPDHTIVFNRNVRICCISATADLAEANGSVIRQDLENERIVEDFGPFKTATQWTDKKFRVRRDIVAKEGTFEAYGMDSKSYYGKHYDIIILDDIQNDQNVRSQKTRQFHIKIFQNTIRPRLVPGGRLLILANKQHPDDFYTYIGKQPEYHLIISKALIRRPESYKIVELPQRELNEFGDKSKWRVEIDLTKDRGAALTEERYPVPRLLALEREIGTAAFSLKYQQEATDDESALIKWAHLQAAKDEMLSYGAFNRTHYLELVSGIDPSLVIDKKAAETKDSDYMVITTMGILPNHHFHLLGLEVERGLTPVEVRKKVVENARIFQPVIQFFETNNFGEIHHWHLKEETGVPIARHHTGGQKYDPFQGYPSLAVLFENGQIRLPYKTEEDKLKTDLLISELYNPEEANHDDRLSSLWICYSGARRLINVWEKSRGMRQRIDERDAAKTQPAKRKGVRVLRVGE